MVRIPTKHILSRLQRLPQTRRGQFLRGATVLMAGVIGGYWAIQSIGAAPFSASSEAENGVVAGNALLTNDSSASGAKTVAFGNGTPTVPTDVTAITGGTSVALRWSPSTANGSTIKQYNILRNNTQIGTIDPTVFNPDYPEKDGCGFVDKTITKGTTYTYQVQAVTSTNTVSALSQAISVKPPTATTPTPTYTINSSGAPQLDSYLRNMVVPFLQIWYPKVADRNAYPDYTPATSITIAFDASLTGGGHLAETDPDLARIRVDPVWVQNNYNNPANPDRGLALFLHESGHVIQGDQVNKRYSNGRWSDIEGGADFPLEYIADTRPAVQPQGIDYYTDGYSQGAWMINWIMTNYDSTYFRKVTVDGHKNQFGVADITFANGKSIDQAWAAARGQIDTTGQFKNVGTGKCLDGENGNTNSGTKLQIYDCLGNVNQRMTVWPNNDGTVSLHILDNCVDVQYGGTANGTPVWIYDCYRNAASQEWNIMPDGSLVNPNSGRCLDIPNGGNGGANNTAMEIWDCNGISAQKWTLPANAIKPGPFTFRSNTAKCIDDPNGTTSNGTQLQVWDCNSNVAQKWSVIKKSDGTATIIVLGKCMDVSGSGTGTTNGTAVQIWSCNSSAAQSWQLQSNGSLKNVNSGKCLDTTTKTVANSAQLVINDCNGSASQTFNFP